MTHQVLHLDRAFCNKRQAEFPIFSQGFEEMARLEKCVTEHVRDKSDPSPVVEAIDRERDRASKTTALEKRGSAGALPSRRVSTPDAFKPSCGQKSRR